MGGDDVRGKSGCVRFGNRQPRNPSAEYRNLGFRRRQRNVERETTWFGGAAVA